MSTEKLTGYADKERGGRSGTGTWPFIRMAREFCDRFPFFLCFLISLYLTPTSGAISTDGTAERNVADFYHVDCHSHYFELSIKSFSAIWMCINAIVFVCAFAVFMKHWCYKAFTSDTSKGY
ncbi:B73 [Murid betaherpesvirus 8]|uniref:B73 n=2 Tax=Rat cytomegalovirus (isolate England) TaxID=1261657 RepID=K7XWC3_RCMVE|nr:E73 [Murid betaherpesvirus 8]AKE44240.1 a73 [Rat cytomegalovirus ALL-03]AFX83388.1 E73 [Murid betaherpesvirus 8]AKB93267.1 B73 [Murid betaherpesvirus 8]WEG71860.1 envelope glycoprotein N [Murid betaherpesvirus 8]WPH24982.1 B73 [Murid betaherpesvirus 8]